MTARINNEVMPTMNTSKTLLQILVEELPKHGGWPDGVAAMAQDADGAVQNYADTRDIRISAEYADGDSRISYSYSIIADECDVATDRLTAIITREQYEAALAAQAPVANADGWIEWAGGECPVNADAMVDVMFRYKNQVATNHAYCWRWDRNGTDSDIIAYRLHQPQEAEQAEADDESDLNDCIGQTPAPVWNGCGVPPVGAEFNYGSHRSRAKCLAVGLNHVFASKGDPNSEDGDYEEILIDKGTSFHPVDDVRDGLMRDIMKAAGIRASAAETIANQLIDAGYRKQ